MVGTPIGNLEDLSPRARRILASVDLIVAEDTRRTRELLAALGLHKPLRSFHEHTSPRQRAALVAALAEQDLAFVTDAGTPGVSDPGAELVADALAAGHRVVAVPGPSAVVAALSVSGFPANSYLFVGYLPRAPSDRRRLLATLANEPRTIVAFETPQRLRAALADLELAFGPQRMLAVARELTKFHEEVWRGTVSEARQAFASRQPRGEFTLVLAGAPAAEAKRWPREAVESALDECQRRNVPPRSAARQIAAASGWQAREVYRLIHDSRSTPHQDRGTHDEPNSA